MDSPVVDYSDWNSLFNCDPLLDPSSIFNCESPIQRAFKTSDLQGGINANIFGNDQLTSSIELSSKNQASSNNQVSSSSGSSSINNSWNNSSDTSTIFNQNMFNSPSLGIPSTSTSTQAGSAATSNNYHLDPPPLTSHKGQETIMNIRKPVSKAQDTTIIRDSHPSPSVAPIPSTFSAHGSNPSTTRLNVPPPIVAYSGDVQQPYSLPQQTQPTFKPTFSVQQTAPLVQPLPRSAPSSPINPTANLFDFDQFQLSYNDPLSQWFMNSFNDTNIGYPSTSNNTLNGPPRLTRSGPSTPTPSSRFLIPNIHAPIPTLPLIPSFSPDNQQLPMITRPRSHNPQFLNQTQPVDFSNQSFFDKLPRRSSSSHAIIETKGRERRNAHVSTTQQTPKPPPVMWDLNISPLQRVPQYNTSTTSNTNFPQLDAGGYVPYHQSGAYVDTASYEAITKQAYVPNPVPMKREEQKSIFDDIQQHHRISAKGKEKMTVPQVQGYTVNGNFGGIQKEQQQQHHHHTSGMGKEKIVVVPQEHHGYGNGTFNNIHQHYQTSAKANVQQVQGYNMNGHSAQGIALPTVHARAPKEKTRFVVNHTAEDYQNGIGPSRYANNGRGPTGQKLKRGTEPARPRAKRQKTSASEDQAEDQLSDQEPDEINSYGNVYIRCEWPRSDNPHIPCRKLIWVMGPGNKKSSAIRAHLQRCKYHYDVEFGQGKVVCRFGNTGCPSKDMMLDNMDRHITKTAFHMKQNKYFQRKVQANGMPVLVPLEGDEKTKWLEQGRTKKDDAQPQLASSYPNVNTGFNHLGLPTPLPPNNNPWY